eukprot:12687318-Alexandrium_andersonii.AAC.1
MADAAAGAMKLLTPPQSGDTEGCRDASPPERQVLAGTARGRAKLLLACTAHQAQDLALSRGRDWGSSRDWAAARGLRPSRAA